MTSSADPKERPNTGASVPPRREALRLAALESLGAVRPEADHVLQELVDEVRGVFGTDLCMVNLILSDVQYFRAWSGSLPEDLAQARQDPRERSMCRYVIESEAPLVVEDFLASERFRDQYFCVNYGIRFYAGTPLVTSDGEAIGTLCLLSTRPIEFGDEQMRVLGAFARAVVGRLELLGALQREQAAGEERARRSRELQGTLDSLSAHIAILDEKGEITTTNAAWRAFAEANGADPKTVLEGANYLRACDSATEAASEYAAAFAEGIRAVLSGRRESFALEYPCHSPTERRWFVGRVTRFSDAGPPRAVVAHENTTARRLAEEALRDQKVQLETILGQAADAIAVCDEGGTFTFANAAARRIAIVDPEGTTLEDVREVWGEAYHPDGRPLPPEEWSIPRALQGETTVGMEARMVRPDGGHYDVLVSAAPLRNAGGKIVGAVAGLLDATERKRAEEDRDRLRAREIEASAQKEERRRIARDMHDVVLQDLSGVLQSLRLTHLRSKNAGLGLDLEEELAALGRAASGLRGAIYDLRHEWENSFVESVESLVQLNRQLAPEREIALEIEEGLRETVPSEVGLEMLRILREALTNVRRHSRAKNVEVRLRTVDETLVAEVADDGCGFNPVAARGGVGLVGMQERAEAVGGGIEVSSRPGDGTRITVRVPLGGGTRAPRRL